MATKEVRGRLTLDTRAWKSGLSKADRQLAGFRRNAGFALAGVAVAGAAAARSVGLIGAKFEQSQAGIQAVTRATTSQMKQLETQARKLGAETSFSATEASEALHNLALQGFSVEKAIKSSEAVLKFAGATMSDLGESAELVAFQMGNFTDQAVTAEQAANILFASTTKGALNFERLQTAMVDAGPTAGQFGVALEETAASLALFSKRGQVGQKAGVALRNIILELTINAEQYADAITPGIIQSEGLAAALEQIEKSGVPVEELMGRMGKRGGPQLGILLGFGSKALRGMTEELTGTNAAFEAYDVTQNTTIGAVNRLKSVLQELALRVFEVGKDALRDSLDKAAKVVRENLDKLASAARGVAAVIKDVGAATADATAFLWDMRAAIVAVTAAVVAYSVAISGAVIATRAWGVVLAIATGAVAPWALALGLVAGVIAGLIVDMGGWERTLIKLSGRWKELGSEAQEFAELWNRGAKLVDDTFLALWDSIKIIGEAISLWIKGKGAEMSKFFSNLVVAFKTRDVSGLFDGVTEAFDAFAAQAKAKVAELEGVWDPLHEEFRTQTAEIQAENNRRLDAIRVATLTKLAAIDLPTWTIPMELPPLGPDDLAPILGPEMRPMIPPDALNDLRDDVEDTLSKVEVDPNDWNIGPWKIPLVFDRPPENLFGPEFGPEYRPFAPEAEADFKSVLNIAQETAGQMSAAFDTAWNAIVDVHISGAERVRAIWGSVMNAALGVIGSIVKAWVFHEEIRSGATVAGEATRTQATEIGSTLRKEIVGGEAAATVASAALSQSAHEVGEVAKTVATTTGEQVRTEATLVSSVIQETAAQGASAVKVAATVKDVSTHVGGEKTKTTASVVAQKVQTEAAVVGSNIRVAAALKAAQANNAETTSSIKAAAGDQMKAHAKIPFVGIAIAIGLIGTMLAFMKGLPKFARGGPVESTPGGPIGGLGKGEVPILAHAGEFVVRKNPAKQFRQLLEDLNAGRVSSLIGRGAGVDELETTKATAERIKGAFRVEDLPNFEDGGEIGRANTLRLEQIRKAASNTFRRVDRAHGAEAELQDFGFSQSLGAISSVPAPPPSRIAESSGGGTTTINIEAPIMVGEGSLLFADDSDSWKRVAVRLHDTIEDAVKPHYRQTAP